MSRDRGFRLVQEKGSYGTEDIFEASSLAEIREFIEAKEAGSGKAREGD